MEKADLINALKDDLAYEYQAVITYLAYSAAVTGPYRGELREFFQQEIPDEMQHAQYLADKIAALGGTPTTEPAAVPAANAPKQMLENVLEAEKDAIRRYTERAAQAEKLGDKGLQVQLEDMVRDETQHMEETSMLLANWDKQL